MDYIVIGRVFDGKNLVGVHIFCINTLEFSWVTKSNFSLLFQNNVLNCRFNGVNLVSLLSWLPIRCLPTYNRFGKLTHVGAYSITKIVSRLTNIDINIVGVKICGAIAGAITNEFSPKAEAHANLYYDEVRAMSTDIYKISENTGFAIEDIAKIKNYIFTEYHNLSTGYKRFEPNFVMALSWQRLMQGDYKPHDITLLRHELMELDLVNNGMAQDNAHILAQKKYNYNKEVEDYHVKTGKY